MLYNVASDGVFSWRTEGDKDQHENKELSMRPRKEVFKTLRNDMYLIMALKAAFCTTSRY